MAARGDAGVFAGDVLKRNAACLLLFDCFGDDHGSHMRWQVHDCSSSSSRMATRTSAGKAPWLLQYTHLLHVVRRKKVCDERSTRH